MPLLCSALLLSACGTPSDTPKTDATVETALGTLNAPSTIGSVVILEGHRDLDFPVVGYPFEEAGSLELESPLATQLEQAKLNGTEEIFSADDISLEAIAAADPDLIISRLSDVEPIQEQLETIAPVLPIGE
ncbi:hypothetical protein [Corynebacterium glutamicum]|uniref:hypothetical protein n=1 Tax=Corynebacterium glutamicum TaxID=1718 RepID=UPI000AD6294B|nr:hypothetical protein [Corynebacterium glutamicum]